MTHSAQSSPGLIRILGPWVATAIVVGTVIGSGIFKKPSDIASKVPDFTTIAVLWILGGLLSLLGALALAEVAVLFPRAGGNYIFLREGYGRWAGFLWGWVEFWMIRTGSIAALATAFVESLHDILKQTLASSGQNYMTAWEQRWLTVGVIAVLALVNIRGVRWGGGLQFFITLVKIGSLLAILFLPVVLWNYWQPMELSGPAQPVPFSWTGIGAAFWGILWAYHGWMNLGPIAGEVKDPQRNLPVALLAGTAIVVFLYLGANLAYHMVIPQSEMAKLGTTTVVAVFGQQLLGPVGTVLASAVVMCSVFGALNGNLLVGPRLLFAMGEDRLAPKVMGAVHPTFHTPARAIAAMAGWSALLILIAPILSSGSPVPSEVPKERLPLVAATSVGLLGSPPGPLLAGATLAPIIKPRKPIFDMLTDYAMFGAVIFETLAVTTIFVFRRTLPGAERPYRCWGYPWVPLLYLVLPLYILGSTLVNPTIEAVAGLGFIALGAAIYLLFLKGEDQLPGSMSLGKD
jgi:APA family basic amino acid/polyamine antiporter